MTERDALRALRAARAQVFETHRRAFQFWRDNGQPAKAADQRRLAEQVRAEVEDYDRRIRDRRRESVGRALEAPPPPALVRVTHHAGEDEGGTACRRPRSSTARC